MTKNENFEATMMCWESTNNITEEKPHKEPEKVAKKPVEKMEKLKHEEEHVESTLNIGNRLKTLSKNLVGREKMTDLHGRWKNTNSNK